MPRYHHGIPPPLFFVAISVSSYAKSCPHAHGLPYILRCTYIEYPWRWSPIVHISRSRSPALSRSLARSCAACHAHAKKMLSLMVCACLSESRYIKRTAYCSDTHSRRLLSTVLMFSKDFEMMDLSLRQSASKVDERGSGDGRVRGGERTMCVGWVRGRCDAYRSSLGA